MAASRATTRKPPAAAPAVAPRSARAKPTPPRQQQQKPPAPVKTPFFKTRAGMYTLAAVAVAAIAAGVAYVLTRKKRKPRATTRALYAAARQPWGKYSNTTHTSDMLLMADAMRYYIEEQLRTAYPALQDVQLTVEPAGLEEMAWVQQNAPSYGAGNVVAQPPASSACAALFKAPSTFVAVQTKASDANYGKLGVQQNTGVRALFVVTTNVPDSIMDAVTLSIRSRASAEQDVNPDVTRPWVYLERAVGAAPSHDAALAACSSVDTYTLK
uniref:Uncharacterized protein n=1 Tax=viral metagenome TaxID=1070528 RepID=A0A6C0ATF3_9ZZZZ